MTDNETTVAETETTETDVTYDATGITAKDNIGHLDFITSIVLMLVCIVSSVMAYGYYVKSKSEFYASPGFMPVIIAGFLFLLSLSLMLKSLKNSSVRENIRRLFEAIPRGLKSLRFKNSVIGLAIFGLYIFVLMRFLPFWLASLIVVFASFTFLKAAKPVKSAIIAILSVGGIVLLFQFIFRVPMP